MSWLRITPNGQVRCLYGEEINLLALGRVFIHRASYVEYDHIRAAWVADLGPVRGPFLMPFKDRSEALAAEKDWLERNLLGVEP